ncbi:MAG: hypothetical protein ACI3Z0_01770 [Candidatus Cryptobacteroides sp.]
MRRLLIGFFAIVMAGTLAAVSCKDNCEDILATIADRNEGVNPVYGLLVQGTCNPVFGSFALPVGLQSNMLMAYAGWSEADVTFPEDGVLNELTKSPVAGKSMDFLTTDDLRILRQGENFEQLEIKQGDFLFDMSEGNAGKVYVTINPNTVDFTGETLSLVNSRDEESVVKLSELKKSEELLSFGHTRADNGFYEATASILSEEDARAALVKADELSPIVSQALMGLYANGGGNLSTLSRAISDQFEGITPAYALKASWTDPGDEVTHSVYSNYSLAATCFQPLSYNSLYKENVPFFPILTPLSGFEFDLSEFTFDSDFPEVEIEGVTIDFQLDSVSIDVTGNITVTITVPDVIDNGDGTYTIVTKNVDVVIKPEDLEDFLTEVEDSLNATFSSWNDELQKQLEDAVNNLAEQVQKQVNDAIEGIQGQVEDQISDLVDDITGEIEGALNGTIEQLNEYIDIYNSVAERLNGLLDINTYLHPTILYQGADGNYYQLSNFYGMPTPFALDGGDVVTLLPTSYTGEIAVPAYRKFIGVTDVWNTDEPFVRAQAGDNTCLQLAKDANNQYLMCTPVDGNVRRVPLKLTGKGYTYEIVYTSLDYSGMTLTSKFYISVN